MSGGWRSAPGTLPLKLAANPRCNSPQIQGGAGARPVSQVASEARACREGETKYCDGQSLDRLAGGVGSPKHSFLSFSRQRARW